MNSDHPTIHTTTCSSSLPHPHVLRVEEGQPLSPPVTSSSHHHHHHHSVVPAAFSFSHSHPPPRNPLQGNGTALTFPPESITVERRTEKDQISFSERSTHGGGACGESSTGEHFFFSFDRATTTPQQHEQQQEFEAGNVNNIVVAVNGGNNSSVSISSDNPDHSMPLDFPSYNALSPANNIDNEGRQQSFSVETVEQQQPNRKEVTTNGVVQAEEIVERHRYQDDGGLLENDEPTCLTEAEDQYNSTRLTQRQVGGKGVEIKSNTNDGDGDNDNGFDDVDDDAMVVPSSQPPLAETTNLVAPRHHPFTDSRLDNQNHSEAEEEEEESVVNNKSVPHQDNIPFLCLASHSDKPVLSTTGAQSIISAAVIAPTHLHPPPSDQSSLAFILEEDDRIQEERNEKDPPRIRTIIFVEGDELEVISVKNKLAVEASDCQSNNTTPPYCDDDKNRSFSPLPPPSPTPEAVADAFNQTMSHLLKSSRGSMPIAAQHLLKGACGLFFAPSFSFSSSSNSYVTSSSHARYYHTCPLPTLDRFDRGLPLASVNAPQSPPSAPQSFEELHEKVRLIMQTLEDRLPLFVREWNAFHQQYVTPSGTDNNANPSTTHNPEQHTHDLSSATNPAPTVPTTPTPFIMLPELLAMAVDLAHFLTADANTTNNNNVTHAHSTTNCSIRSLVRKRREEMQEEAAARYQQSISHNNNYNSGKTFRLTPVSVEIRDLEDVGKMLWNRLTALFQRHQLLPPVRNGDDALVSSGATATNTHTKKKSTPKPPSLETTISRLLSPHHEHHHYECSLQQALSTYTTTRAIVRSLAVSLATLGQRLGSSGDENCEEGVDKDDEQGYLNQHKSEGGEAPEGAAFTGKIDGAREYPPRVQPSFTRHARSSSVPSSSSQSALFEQFMLMLRAAKGFLDAFEEERVERQAEAALSSVSLTDARMSGGAATESSSAVPSSFTHSHSHSHSYLCLVSPQFLVASALSWLKSCNHFLDAYPHIIIMLDSTKPSHTSHAVAARSSSAPHAHVAPLRNNQHNLNHHQQRSNSRGACMNDAADNEAGADTRLIHSEKAAAALHEFVTCYCVCLLASSPVTPSPPPPTTASLGRCHALGNRSISSSSSSSTAQDRSCPAKRGVPNGRTEYSASVASSSSFLLGPLGDLLCIAKDVMERIALFVRVLSSFAIADTIRNSIHQRQHSINPPPLLGIASLPPEAVAAFATFIDAFYSCVREQGEEIGGRLLLDPNYCSKVKATRAVSGNAKKSSRREQKTTPTSETANIDKQTASISSSDDDDGDGPLSVASSSSLAKVNVIYFLIPEAITVSESSAADVVFGVYHGTTNLKYDRRSPNNTEFLINIKSQAKSFLQRVVEVSESLALFARLDQVIEPVAEATHACTDNSVATVIPTTTTTTTTTTTSTPLLDPIATTSAALVRVTCVTASIALALVEMTGSPHTDETGRNFNNFFSASLSLLQRAADHLSDSSFEALCDGFYTNCTPSSHQKEDYSLGNDEQESDRKHHTKMKLKNPFAAHLLLRAGALNVSVHCHMAMINTIVENREGKDQTDTLRTLNGDAASNMKSATSFFRAVLLQLAHPTNGVFAILNSESGRTRGTIDDERGKEEAHAEKKEEADRCPANSNNNNNVSTTHSPRDDRQCGSGPQSPAIPYIIASCDALVRSQLACFLIRALRQVRSMAEGNDLIPKSFALSVRRDGDACWEPYKEALALFGGFVLNALTVGDAASFESSTSSAMKQRKSIVNIMHQKASSMLTASRSALLFASTQAVFSMSSMAVRFCKEIKVIERINSERGLIIRGFDSLTTLLTTNALGRVRDILQLELGIGAAGQQHSEGRRFNSGALTVRSSSAISSVLIAATAASPLHGAQPLHTVHCPYQSLIKKGTSVANHNNG